MIDPSPGRGRPAAARPRAGPFAEVCASVDIGRLPNPVQPVGGKPAPPDPTGRPWRILVVDDQEDAYVVAASLLHRVDRRMETVWAPDARSGEAHLLQGGFDACLVDLALGPEDGLDLIRRVTAAGTDVPLIALTGRLASSARATIAAGATDFLDKGELTSRDLQRSIRLGIARTETSTRLRASEEMHRSVVAALAEGIIVQDSNGAVTAANGGAERILGLSLDELSGRTSVSPEWRAVRADGTPFPGDSHPSMITLRTGQPQHGVVMGVHHPGGELRWLTVNTEPVWRPGWTQPFAVVASFTDVTAQRQLEEQLRQASRMEAVGRLAGGVAHDFNNLLTAITGYGELVITDPSLDGTTREHVEEIRRAAARAASLTRQLLAFSRRQMLRPESIVVDDVIVNMQSMIGRLIPGSIALEVKPGAEGRTVRADRGQLEQVILNLVTNARDALPEGGTLCIETSTIRLDAAHAFDEAVVQPGTYVQISVADDGSGMDASTKAHVFEPFFTTKEHGRGTGLGLASVYGTVKQSGGYVWVYSEPDQGTTVKVYLPISGEEGTPEANLPAPTGQWRARPAESILLAEDDAAVRGFVSRILERAGYTVLVAVDGTSAVELASALDGPISCLVSDVMMPGLRGPDVLERLRKTRQDLPAVLISGYTEDTAGLSRSITDRAVFLQKPFATDELLKSIRTLIDDGTRS